MQEQYCNLKRLLNKREDRLARAQSLSSPGFGGDGGGGGDTCAPYERDILDAADLECDIDQAMLAFVNAVEDENMAILLENCGRQRQCVLRLKSIAGKSLWEIADILDVSIKTVKNRLNDTGEEADSCRGDCGETYSRPLSDTLLRDWDRVLRGERTDRSSPCPG